MKWNETALDILRALANVFHVSHDEIVFTYTDWEYASWHYIRNNSELIETAREIVLDKRETYEECDSLDLFPADLDLFLAATE